MYQTTDFRKGLKIEYDNKVFVIVDFQHVNPGKGSAFVRSKIKNLMNGSVQEKTFRAGESIELAQMEKASMQYTFTEGNLVPTTKNY